MTKITADQAQSRFQSLTGTLQDALFSIQNAEIIAKAAEQNHLDFAKTDALAEVVGLVFLGFIHIEDVAREFQERTQVPPAVAGAVALSLENKIFNPAKSDIERMYAPALHPIELGEGMPTIVEEVKPIAGMPERAPQSAPATPPPPFMNPAPAPSTEPAPVLLHEEAAQKPLTPNFRLEMPQPKLGDVKPNVPPVKPAVLELGNAPPPPKAASDVAPPKARIVHYTDWRTPVGETNGPAPIGSVAGENSPPKPPTPPAPPAPPRPGNQPGGVVDINQLR